MQTILRLNASELTSDFLASIKALIKDKKSIITVKIETVQDETEYLLSSPKNAKALEEALNTKEGYEFTWDEFKKLNKDLLKGVKIDSSKLKKVKLAL